MTGQRLSYKTCEASVVKSHDRANYLFQCFLYACATHIFILLPNPIYFKSLDSLCHNKFFTTLGTILHYFPCHSTTVWPIMSAPISEQEETRHRECDISPSEDCAYDKHTEVTEDRFKNINPDSPTIMVAGRARNGKSTALNNIFDLKLEAKASARSVTQAVSVTEVKKKFSIKEGKDSVEKEVVLQVIDTPGLGAIDIPKEDIIRDMQKVTNGIDYTLVYCFSVSPANALTETDKAIIENLHLALGKNVWEKCVLLFTFSDHAYAEFDNVMEYKQHIKSHANEFEKLLESLGSEASAVKTIFEKQSLEELDQEEKQNEIVAIPVKKKTTKSSDVLPDILKEGQDWTDVVFIELMKKTSKTRRESFFFFKYLYMGSYLGKVAGSTVGAFLGPVLSTIGAKIGAHMGAAAGLTIGAVAHLIEKIKRGK